MLPDLLSLPKAILALADGTIFQGTSIGAAGHTVGEVVFNTALTGYQEILTDPSYCRQIVTLTYPHIGNYGVNDEDVEASKVFAAGLIIKEAPLLDSNFRKTRTLQQYLRDEGTVAIADIDTRRLTRVLRTSGAQNGCIMALPAGQAVTEALMAEAIAKAKAAPSMAGLDLAKVVSRTENVAWTQTEWKLGQGYGEQTAPKFHVVRLRLRRQEQHPAHAGRARLQDHRRAGADARLGRVRSGAGRASSCPTAPAIRSPATTRSRPPRS